MLQAQRSYYEAKAKGSPSVVGMAATAYSKAQELFRRHAKIIQEAQNKHEQEQAAKVFTSGFNG